MRRDVTRCGRRSKVSGVSGISASTCVVSNYCSAAPAARCTACPGVSSHADTPTIKRAAPVRGGKARAARRDLEVALDTSVLVLLAKLMRPAIAWPLFRQCGDET